MGDSLTDYIMQKRMEKAKLLLITTQVKISQVAFRKYAGATPQDFRKENKLQ